MEGTFSHWNRRSRDWSRSESILERTWSSGAMMGYQSRECGCPETYSHRPVGRKCGRASSLPVEMLGHVDPAKPLLLGPMGFHEPQAPIEGSVLRHGLVRIEPDHPEAP